MKNSEINDALKGIVLDIDVKLLDVDFEEIKPTHHEPHTIEEKMVAYNRDVLGVKVSSVYLPKNFIPCVKPEEEVSSWLDKKVHSTKNASYKYKKKYMDSIEKASFKHKEKCGLN